jgi:quercetin dioxygenase-like cupin family protein
MVGEQHHDRGTEGDAMAHVGTTIENPVAGDSLTFVATREDGSTTLVCDITTIRGAQGPPEHVHPSSSELFEVQEGAIMVEVEGVRHTLDAGQTITVPPGVPHKFASDPEQDGRTLVTFDVPGQIEDALVTFYELARAGRVAADGKPSMQQVAVTFSQLASDMRATIAPWAAQRVMFSVLAPIGRRRGLKPFYTWGELD